MLINCPLAPTFGIIIQMEPDKSLPAPIISHVVTNVADNQVVIKSEISKKTYLISFAFTCVAIYLTGWSQGIFDEDADIAFFVITLLLLIIFAIMAIKEFPLNHKKNNYIRNLCKANPRFSYVDWTPQHAVQEGIAPSVIWKTIEDLGRSSQAADLDSQYHIAFNSIRGQGDKGEVFHLGRLNRVGPYADYMFIAIDIPMKLPSILVDADATLSPLAETDFAYRLKADNRYELEGEFAKYFTLYGAEPTSIRLATYIFTPDIMEKFLGVTKKADIEFHGNRLYILWRTPATSSQSAYTEAFTMLNTVGSLLLQRISKYLHPDEVVGTPLLLNEIDRSAYGKVAEVVGKYGGGDIRKSVASAFSGQRAIRGAIFFATIIVIVIVIIVASYTITD